MGKRIKKRHETAKRIEKLQQKNRDLKLGYIAQEEFYKNKMEKQIEEQHQQHLKEIMILSNKHKIAQIKLENKLENQLEEQRQAQLKELAAVSNSHCVMKHKLEKEEMAHVVSKVELEKERQAHEDTKKRMQLQVDVLQQKVQKYESKWLIRKWAGL